MTTLSNRPRIKERANHPQRQIATSHAIEPASVKHNIPFVRPWKIHRPQVRLKTVFYTEIECNFFQNPMYPHSCNLRLS